jgi:hypothetical protein
MRRLLVGPLIAAAAAGVVAGAAAVRYWPVEPVDTTTPAERYAEWQPDGLGGRFRCVDGDLQVQSPGKQTIREPVELCREEGS